MADVPDPQDAGTPITFLIPGVGSEGLRRGGGEAALLPTPLGLAGEVKASVRVGLRRDQGEVQRVVAVPGQDVVALHIDNGPTLVLHPENARDLLRAQASPPSRGAGARDVAARGDDPVEVHPQLRWQGLEQAAAGSSGTTRGFLGDVVLKLVEVVDLKGRTQQVLAEELVRRIDGRVEEGVYGLQEQALGPLKGQPKLERLPEAPGGGPSLVFVHGTFSTTSESGFGRLWSDHPQQLASLFRHYGGRVYGLDHATLGRTPIQNALTLAQACPDGTRLHLISHSRGGLVAEVLARAAALERLDEAAHTCFSGEDGQEQRDQLERLIVLMQERRILVERVMRVACPARGTLLAGNRLDAYLSVLQWSLKLAGLPVVPELVEFLGGVARLRTDPHTIPGIAAMAPKSPLVRWLHGAETVVPGQLRVVAGDLRGDSVGSWVKTLMADAFFWTDNDLVVQTRSMYGGVPREAGASFVLDRGGKASHFNYFTNALTAEAIVNGLIQESPRDWRVIGPLSYAGASSEGVRGGGQGTGDGRPQSDKPAVIVLPGILGSNLKVNGRRVWVSGRFFNRFLQLEYPEPPGRQIEPDGPVGNAYDALMDDLGDSHEVIPFSYDWRQPIEKEARRLSALVETALAARDRSGQPVRLLAHSMGGLVARALQLERPALWDQLFARPGARLLMLGTPNDGSWAPMQVLSGDDNFGQLLTALGAPFQDAKARQVMAGMPGFLQMQAGLLDPALNLASAEEWQKLAGNDENELFALSAWHQEESQRDAYQWGVPTNAVLEQAVDFSRKLRQQVERDLPNWRDKLALVVGAAPLTPVGYRIDPDGLVYLNSHDGDGRVSHTSAMLPGVRTWQLKAEHGRLPSVKEAFKAFRDLLETGTTTNLPTFDVAAPSRGGVGADASVAPAALIPSRPSRQKGTAEPRSSDNALYEPPGEPDSEVLAPAGGALAITVHHSDLAFVRQPLMLGHYIATTLTGTEKVVNRLIGGAMEEALSMGHYPDRPGSHQVFVNNNRINPFQPPRPASVIVVGLGEEGKLKGSELSYSVRMAVLAQAQRLMDGAEGAPSSFELAATLLGSGGTGINAALAAQLITQGVLEANRLLRRQEHWPVVGALHLVELYLDRASIALNALQVLAEGQPGQILLTPTVTIGQGGMPRPLDWGYRGVDYDFISALTAATDSEDSSSAVIHYTVDSKRARSELRAQSTQRRLVSELVQRASNDRNDDAEIGRTLFKLLVPVEMEPTLGGSSELVLELDRGSAGIPWELLDGDGGDRQADDHWPWAIRTKLLRKLRLAAFQQQILDASANERVLVIGEPLAPKGFSRLPGARQEAREVARALIGPGLLDDGKVEGLIAGEAGGTPQPDSIQVITTLMRENWRILHISGHGELPSPGNHRGGVVLSGGLHLGPQEIGNLRVKPELVFLNCCHLAAIDGNQLLSDPLNPPGNPLNRPEFASSMAEALISSGVRCVVAAGWAVGDLQASTFARVFYGALARGERFIDATRQARLAAWREGGNTWAAYQCYGDPEWVFRSGVGDAQRPVTTLGDDFAGVVSPRALIQALESLRIRGSFQGLDRTDMGTQLRYLESRFAPLWGQQGEVAHGFGQSWAQVDDVERAIGWYERGLCAEDGGASLRSSEQLANLRVRRAWDRVKAASSGAEGGATPPAPEQLEKARDQIKEQLTLLDQLSSFGKTMERLSLCGSAFKRLALLERLAGRQQEERAALVGMRDRYAEAEEIGRSAGLPDRFYPALNTLAAESVLQATGGTWSALDQGRITALRQSLADKVRRDPDFWSLAAQGELKIYEALADRTLQGSLPAILQSFEDLRQRVSAPGKWQSVRDQLDFLLPPYITGSDLGEQEIEAARLLLETVTAWASGNP